MAFIPFDLRAAVGSGSGTCTLQVRAGRLDRRVSAQRSSVAVPETTGGVSYTVGVAAAPPTLSSAPPTFCVATPSFERFYCGLTSEWLYSITSLNVRHFLGLKMLNIC